MSKHDEMYRHGVYAQRATEWLAKAQAKSVKGDDEAAAVYVEGAKVYAMLAETARKSEEMK